MDRTTSQQVIKVGDTIWLKGEGSWGFRKVNVTGETSRSWLVTAHPDSPLILPW